MTALDVVSGIPARQSLIDHRRELGRFAAVGGTTWVLDTATYFLLTASVLADRPITAKIIAVGLATVLSYLLSREWSFRDRGRRGRSAEVVGFVTVSALSMLIAALPLGMSRYVFGLVAPEVSLLVQHVADFVSGQVVGVVLAVAFRWWALRRFVFPRT